MSKVTLYIEPKPFIRQWLEKHFGNPVRFPEHSLENITIRRYLQKLPKGETPDLNNGKSLPVCIPDSKPKPTDEGWSYMGTSGKEALISVINDNFNLCLWNELWDIYFEFFKNKQRFLLGKHVRAWCESHGIDKDYDNTIMQRFNRMRAEYCKNGVDLRLHQNFSEKLLK